MHPNYVPLIQANLPGRVDFTAPDRPRTLREPGDTRFLPHRTPPADLPPQFQTIDWFNVDEILEDSNWVSFSNPLEDIHGGVHGWVGGSMSTVATAAFDPIFFSHHSMVDKLGFDWQVKHGAVGPDEQMWDVVLTPFPVTVRDMLNVEQLNYDYVEKVVEV